MAVLRNGKVTHFQPPGCRASVRIQLKNSNFRARKRPLRGPIRKPEKPLRTEVRKSRQVINQVKKIVPTAGKRSPPEVPEAGPRKVNKDAVRKKLMKDNHMEQAVVDLIISTILIGFPKVSFDEIIGQDDAVRSLKQRVVYPALNPELFRGQKVLKPPRGVLLYGPTGNGKTLLAKACASQTHYNFMNVSASALVSKWVGDSEKLVKLLFECAKEIQPTIIFIDEIDAMLSQRSGAEREDTRRFKNEFLVHFDGMLCSNDDRVLILGATNLPYCIDTAALRRFDLRVYMGTPDLRAREKVLKTILKDVANNISTKDIRKIATLTHGFSAADLGTIARNAAWLPLGSLDQRLIPQLKISQVPKLTVEHFEQIVRDFIPSVNDEELAQMKEWTDKNRDRAGAGAKH